MTTYDVKNYLEKIYKVPVLSVRCELIRGMSSYVARYMMMMLMIMIRPHCSNSCL